MDSPVVTLENSLGSLSVPPRLELFLPMLLLHHQILSPETLQLSYTSILVAFFSKKNVPYNGICTTEHTKQKDVSMFHKDVSHRACQKYVLAIFWSKTYKSTGIGEYAGVPRNYSIFELKQC